MKNAFTGEFEAFYEDCLAELRSRNDYTDAYLPMLERFVLVTMKASKLGAEIVDAEVVTEHTNNKLKKNKKANPAWRMFLALNMTANALARELRLSPMNAPSSSTKKKTAKGFDLGTMKVAK